MTMPSNPAWSSMLAGLVLFGCASPPAPGRAMIGAHWGRVDVLDSEPLASYGLEYRFRAENRWHIVPAIGGTLVRDDANFFYGDLRCELWLDEHWSISPRFGLGVFQESALLDLGAPLEFRSGLELEHRLENGLRFSLGFFHISNASLADFNPGTEALFLSFSVPIGR